MSNFVLNSRELLIIYMSIGHIYVDMKEFADSEDYDLLSEDKKLFALESMQETEQLYKRLADYLEGYKIPSMHIYEEDVGRPAPKKEV